MDIKKTVKYDGKFRGLHFEENELIDENGEVIDLNKHMKAAYGDKYFDLSTSSKEEEMLEIVPEDEQEEEEE